MCVSVIGKMADENKVQLMKETWKTSTSDVYLSASVMMMPLTLKFDLCCPLNARRWASFDELLRSLNVSKLAVILSAVTFTSFCKLDAVAHCFYQGS